MLDCLNLKMDAAILKRRYLLSFTQENAADLNSVGRVESLNAHENDGEKRYKGKS